MFRSGSFNSTELAATAASAVAYHPAVGEAPGGRILSYRNRRPSHGRQGDAARWRPDKIMMMLPFLRLVFICEFAFASVVEASRHLDVAPNSGRQSVRRWPIKPTTTTTTSTTD